MNKISTFMIACMLAPLAMLAQTEKNDTDFFKALFGVDKITIVQDFINVNAAQKDAFWATYKEYEIDRKEQRTARIELITDYAENYTSLTDDKLDDLCAESIKQKSKNAKLIKKYYKKLKKDGGSKAAAQFLQVENYFLNLSRVAVSENIPFIGELDKI
tara:strand:+ start:55770 stop:56246 length:477 start_codon:yes stop_codon:yes gene_type:complete